MAIELLDPVKVWAKIRAGFKADTFFKNPVPKGNYRYVDGITSEVKTVQQRNPSVPMSAFGGKTFNGRK